jgi:small subunit ribosomal protein S13
MIRLFGIDIPNKKKIHISLTYIFGIGLATAKNILKMSNIDLNKTSSTLTDEEIARIRLNIEKTVKIEGDLRKYISMNVKRLIDIHCYKGIRHKKRLPLRGQRTHSNAKSCKRRSIMNI